jgi:hypothetical protein
VATVVGVEAADVSVQADVTVGSGQSIGLAARYTGPGDSNMYWAGLTHSGSAVSAELWRNVGGVWTLLGSAPAAATGALRLDVIGAALAVYLDGARVIAATDAALAGPGGAAVRGTGGTVDNLTVAAPPVVASVAVNGGAAQRSRVTELTVTFDMEVVLDPGAFALTRPADGATVGMIAVATQVVGGRTMATLTFGGANVESGSLADGRWVLTADRTRVRSLVGVELAADFTSQLHRFFGDSDGDADVDVPDLGRFRQAYGRSVGQPGYAAHVDFEGDGDVDVLDLGRFRQRYGRTLP